jgi:hypothetical protein
VSTNDLEATRSPLQSGKASPSPHHGYDPNQPRVPSGHRDGGQWTRTGSSGAPTRPRREAVVDRSKQETWGSYVDTYHSDGTLAEQRVFKRDGSRIVSEFNVPGSAGDWDERHTVVLSDGSKVTFQTSGDVQEIYDGDGNLISASVWTKDGPQSLPAGQLAYLGPVMLGVGAGVALRLGPRAITAAALALFAWLYSRKDRDGTAVFAFKAARYENRGTREQPEISWVGYVKRDDLENVCDKLGRVQELTDAAVKKVREDGEYKGPADFGTQVHEQIAKEVEGEGDSNFRAEKSVLKSELEPREDPNFKTEQSELDEAKRGKRGTVRFDVYENRPDISTVCVYDPKTGKRGLSVPRMTELAEGAFKLFRYVPVHLIVIEVRPGQGQP